MLHSKLNTQHSIDFFSELSKIMNNIHEPINKNAQNISLEPSLITEPSNIIISNNN